MVAGRDLDSHDIVVTGSGPYTASIPLWNITSNTRWTGSGTYDVWIVLFSHPYSDANPYSGAYYKAGSVNFSSATTNVPFSNFTEFH